MRFLVKLSAPLSICNQALDDISNISKDALAIDDLALHFFKSVNGFLWRHLHRASSKSELLALAYPY